MTTESKQAIAKKHYEYIYSKLDKSDKAIIGSSGIDKWFEESADRYRNVHTMKKKIENAIWGTLTDIVIEKTK